MRKENWECSQVFEDAKTMKTAKRFFYLWWAFWATATIALALCVGQASGAMTDCIDATCRISASNTQGKPIRGTGCVFEISNGHAYVLTNAHIATTKTPQMVFWRDGHQSQLISGETIMRDNQADAAIIAIDVQKFNGFLPSVIPIAKPFHKLWSKETIASVGCANGSWATSWKGHVIRYYDNGNDVHFIPIPANGRSGSAIFNAEGTEIVALLRARDDDDNPTYGIATSVQALYRAFGEHSTQCNPNDPNCPKYLQQGQSQWLPYRFQQNQKNQAQDNRIDSLYPTLPQQQQVAPQARPMVPVVPEVVVDLSPIMQGFNQLNAGQQRIASLLEMIRDDVPRLPPAAYPPVETTPVEEVVEETPRVIVEMQSKVELLEAGHNVLAQSVQTLTTNQTEIAAKIKTISFESLGGIDKIKARIAEAKESGKEGAREVARSVVWGVIKSHGLLTGGIFSLVIFIVWRDVRDKVKTGDPLIIEKLFARLGDRFDKVGDRVEDVRDRVRGRFRDDEPTVPKKPEA